MLQTPQMARPVLRFLRESQGRPFHQEHELTPSYREGSASRTQGLLTRVGRQASTGEVSVVAHFEVRVDRIVVGQLDHLLESVVDEDEADQRGEAFFRETSEVLNQEAGIGGHQKETQEGRPQADPKTKLQVVKIMVPGKKTKKTDTLTIPPGMKMNLKITQMLREWLLKDPLQTLHIKLDSIQEIVNLRI